MTELIAVLLLLALLVLIVSALVFGLARGIIWWSERQQRKQRVREAVRHWDPSDRENGGGRAA